MTSHFYFVVLCLLGGPLTERHVSSFVPVPCCPTGWTRLGFRCFIFQNEMKTFSESETTCQSLGGHLASVHNEDEQMLIRQLAGTNTRTWIGGTVSQTLGRVWMWTDGSRFEYQAWYAVEPNNTGGNENCVEIINGGIYQGTWNDNRCDSTFSYVCAKNV